MSLTDDEIKRYMRWHQPDAHIQKHLRKIKLIVAEAERRERESCAMICESKYALSAYKTFADAIRARGG